MPSTILPSFSHIAAAAEPTDRSPRPTSAPAIAQSQVTEGPGAPVKKTQKEAAKVEVKGEEEPPEQAEPEPTEAWKVCLRSLTSANASFRATESCRFPTKLLFLIVSKRNCFLPASCIFL